jgi:hypothetical protein
MTSIRRLGRLLRGRIRRIAEAIEQAIPRPRTKPATSSRRPIRRIVVFARLPNPTIDFYLTARLEAPGMPPSTVVDIRDPALAAIDPTDAFVVVCRYASKRLLTWIERHRGRLAGIAFFTDDDIGAVITGAEAKLGYRFFLYHRAVAPLRRLNHHIDVVWASTPALAEAIGDPRVRVLPPAPHPNTWRLTPRPASTEDAIVRIAYHATGVHVREHRFLAPVIAAVLAARPQAVFEVIADERTAPIWAQMDRVTIRSPMSWPDYFAWTSDRRVDIVLVPLLASRANRIRAGTKRIDVVRLGAAAVFSASPSYDERRVEGEVLLANRRSLWIREVLRLIDDPIARAIAAAASLAWVSGAAARAAEGLPLPSAGGARAVRAAVTEEEAETDEVFAR